MSTMYRIEDAKLNKNLISDEICLTKINKQHGVGPKGPKQLTIREILVDFINEQRAFNKKVVARLDAIEKRLDNIVAKNNLIE